MDWQYKKLAAWRGQPFVQQLLRKFPKADVFLVGGAVRDALLGAPTQDFDFVVRGVGKVALQNFLAKRGAVNLVGKKFGVFKFKPRGWNGAELDIALPRTEHSLHHTGGYRDFKISSHASLSINDDLSRRDFTVNAMAWNIKTGELIDPHGGAADLKKKIIQTVGKPRDRFTEDYSRMLRAIRFACQLDFTIERTTWDLVRSLMKKIDQTISGQRVVPDEVIAKELVKAMRCQPVRAVTLLDQSGALTLLMPELLKMKKCPQPKNWHFEGDVWQHTLLALSQPASPLFKKEFRQQDVSVEVIWALLFHDVGKPQTITKTDRLRFNGHDTMSVEIFRRVAARLKLTSAGLNAQAVEQLISKHMLLANPDIPKMKNTTIEKYFFNPLFPGQELLMMMFADVAASWQPNGKPSFTNYRQLQQRIARLRAKGRNKKILVRPILSGHDIMKRFGLPPGPQIGKLLALAREAQLSGRAPTKTKALALVKKTVKK